MSIGKRYAVHLASEKEAYRLVADLHRTPWSKSDNSLITADLTAKTNRNPRKDRAKRRKKLEAR